MSGAAGAGTVPGQPQTLDMSRHGQMLVPVKGFENPIPLSQLAEGFMRQSDYSNKTMALAAKQQEVDSQTARFNEMDSWFKALDSDPQGTFRSLQRAYNITPDPGTVDGDIEESDPKVASLQAELSAMKSQLEQNSQTSQDLAAQQQLAEQFPDMSLDDVKAYMAASNIEPHRIVDAAKLMSYDRLAEDQRMAAEAEQGRQASLDAIVTAKAGLPPISPGSAPTPSPDLLPTNEPALPSWEESVSLALADIGQAQI